MRASPESAEMLCKDLGNYSIVLGRHRPVWQIQLVALSPTGSMSAVNSARVPGGLKVSLNAFLRIKRESVGLRAFSLH